MKINNGKKHVMFRSGFEKEKKLLTLTINAFWQQFYRIYHVCFYGQTLSWLERPRFPTGNRQQRRFFHEIHLLLLTVTLDTTRIYDFHHASRGRRKTPLRHYHVLLDELFLLFNDSSTEP